MILWTEKEPPAPPALPTLKVRRYAPKHPRGWDDLRAYEAHLRAYERQLQRWTWGLVLGNALIAALAVLATCNILFATNGGH